MNQQEVMELMQRHLDNDLDGEELARLMEHLDHDKESKEIFERMQLLSDNLANLPRVSPPESIVDDIMPELDRLEQEKAKPHQQEKKHQQTKRFWTYGSGILAAAVVLGLFIFYGELPVQHPEAGDRASSNNAALDEVAIFQGDSNTEMEQAPMISRMNDQSGQLDATRTMDVQSEEEESTLENHSFFYEEPDKEGFIAPDEPHYFPPLSAPDSEKVVYLLLKEDGWHLSIRNNQGDEIVGKGPIFADQMLEWKWNDESDRLSARFISGEQEFWTHLDLP